MKYTSPETLLHTARQLRRCYASNVTAVLLSLLLVAGAAFAQPAVTERDIDYAGAARPDQMLDLDVPEGPGPFPLLIHVHGGGWQNGEKGKGAGVAVARPRMGARGYAFATINYRLSGAATFPAQIQDCKAAVRWLRANAAQYRLDPERFAAWGTSAGGHLVALLGTAGDIETFDDPALGNPGVSSRVQAVIDWYGPADFTVWSTSPGSAVSLLLGCTTTACPELAREASPVTHATPDDPPFLIMQGTNDRTVSPEQSRLMAEALLNAGVPVALRFVPGAGHGGNAFNTDPVQQMMDDFLDSLFLTGPPSVTSAADFNFIALAPGAATSIFGANLTGVTASAPTADLPLTLADVSVEIEDGFDVIRRAGIYFASPAQVNFQMPPETASGLTLVRLRRGDDEVLSEWVRVNPAAPALFSADGTGAHWAAGQVAYGDGSIFPLADSGGPVAIDLDAHPAPAFLVIYGTGLGQTPPSRVIAWMADTEAPVAYAGPQGEFPGLDQFNIEIPPALAARGDLDVVISAAGVPSNPVRVRLE